VKYPTLTFYWTSINVFIFVKYLDLISDLTLKDLGFEEKWGFNILDLAK